MQITPGVYKVPHSPAQQVYQTIWGRISSFEEGKGIIGLLGRISRRIKGKGK